MMLPDAARRAAGAGRVDDAGEVLAFQVRGGPGGGGRDVAVLAPDQVAPKVVARVPRLPDAQILDADDVVALGRPHHRGQQHARELGGGHDDGLGPAVLQDVEMVVGRVGRVGRHGHESRGHDREVRHAPFGAVLGHEHDAVAGPQPELLQPVGQARHLLRRLRPARVSPLAIDLARQERRVPALRRAGEEHGDEVGEMFEVAHGFPTHLVIPAKAGISARRTHRTLHPLRSRPLPG